MNVGQITQVLGAVIDVEFENSTLPPIYNALQVTNSAISDKESRARKMRTVSRRLTVGWVGSMS